MLGLTLSYSVEKNFDCAYFSSAADLHGNTKDIICLRSFVSYQAKRDKPHVRSNVSGIFLMTLHYHKVAHPTSHFFPRFLKVVIIANTPHVVVIICRLSLLK